jgi:hypothetical protein
MSKAIKNLGGKTSSAYSIDPTVPVIYGYDVEAPEDSNLVETDKSRLKIDKAMAKNIAARGVIKPIVCRLVKDDEGNETLVVVDGRRRTINARAANEMRAEEGLETLPVRFVLEMGSDKPDALLTMVAANSFSMDHGPMAQAKKAAAMLNAGLSNEDVANAFGFSKATLGNRLKLLELPNPVQKHVESGNLNPMTALELVDEEPDEAIRIAEEIAKEGGGKKGQAGKAKRKKKGGDTEEEGSKPPTRSKLAKMMETEEFAELSEEAQRIIRWVTGDLKTPNTIDGMAAAWKAANAKKKAPPRPEAAE